MHTKRKVAAVITAACLAIGMSGLVATQASATDGQEYIVNGDFSQYDPATGAITDGVTQTQFQLSTDLTEASSPGAGNMYDPGRYAVSTNAGSLHNQWIEQAGNNPKMVLNGFTSGTQTVWAQTTQGVSCPVPGSQIQFEFTADVANVLPLDNYSDGGANIQVFINGVALGDSVDLTSNDGTPVAISSNLIPAAGSFVIEVRNTGTDYIGNDFSLDNLSLVQRGGCLAPVTPTFLSPTKASCDAPGGIEGGTVFPRDMGDFTLDISPAFHGADTYTLTATADAGFAFPTGTVTTAQITVDPLGFGLDCTPSIGGKTLGYYKNHTVTDTQWLQVRNSYTKLFGLAYTTSWTGANGGLSILSASGSTNNGLDMLRAQFLATALNTLTITGYKDQQIAVPVGTAVDGGTTVPVYLFLTHVNAAIGTAALDSKAEITSVAKVLDAINQDIASSLFV